MDRDIVIPEGELEVSTMRSGGSGGQNVNKVETGVRMKHVPTGIAVRCTQERSQMLNKELALNMLKEKLVVVMQEQQTKDLAEIRYVPDLDQQALGGGRWGVVVRAKLRRGWRRRGLRGASPCWFMRSIEYYALAFWCEKVVRRLPWRKRCRLLRG